ncbi:alpha/beta hydrolase [Paenibacillus sp. GCM10027627]|uniref:alpha/beta hydrolase n=1 Tax=unclassified Paenibacillus TaxID=185978 RepID=UPI003629DB94
MLREQWVALGTEAKNIYVREWLPESTRPKAVVLIVHGHGEHGERYQYVAEQLTAADFAVVALDQLGHGRSEGKRGHMSAMSAAIDDVIRIMDEAVERHPGLPFFLYGHSMGGNIALNCAIRRKPEIKGLILTSPWLRLAFKPNAIKEWLGRGVAAVFPSLPMSSGLKPDDLFRPSDLGIRPLHEDPLNHTTITPRTYLEVQAAGEWALRHGKELHVPLLLMHGTSDRVTSYSASKELAESLPGKCEWHSMDDGLHELHNDAGGRERVALVVDWMERQLL